MQHINTTQHKKRINKRYKLNQQLITTNVGEQSSSSDTVSKHLCLVLVSSDIPLRKLNNVQLRVVLEKYTNTNESTLRKNYVPQCFQDVICYIHNKSQDASPYIPGAYNVC